jgi:mRNA interferase MazF
VRRGDVALAVIQGDYGKPRPVVIVQSDLFNASHPSLIVCPVTSTLRDAPGFRLDIPPTPANGLRQPSQIMADKLLAMPRERIGSVDDEMLLRLNRALALVLGLAGI